MMITRIEKGGMKIIEIETEEVVTEMRIIDMLTS